VLSVHVQCGQAGGGEHYEDPGRWATPCDVGAYHPRDVLTVASLQHGWNERGGHAARMGLMEMVAHSPATHVVCQRHQHPSMSEHARRGASARGQLVREVQEFSRTPVRLPH